MERVSKLNTDSPIGYRLGAWAQERFEPENAVLFFVLYAAALLLGRSVVTSGPIEVRVADLVGFIAVWSFFLMLRVFDEHKDYDLDCHNHPHRVLQSGLITLGHLKALGLLAIAAQVGASVYLDRGLGSISTAWLAVMAWSCLMAVEFFCGEWLERRLVLYAVSHMVVMPMALVWMAQMGAGAAQLPMSIGWLAALSFLTGASFEVARKMKAPEDERETIDSYTKALGVAWAPLVVLSLLVGATIVLTVVISGIFDTAMSGYWYVIIVAPLVPAAWALLRFRRAPSAAAGKLCEAMVAVVMLSGYLGLLVAIFLERGFAWS